MPERNDPARDNALPTEVMMAVSETYVGIAEKITGEKLTLSDNPKAEIIATWRSSTTLSISSCPSAAGNFSGLLSINRMARWFPA